MEYTSFQTHIETNFSMITHGKFNLSEILDMTIYEKEIYLLLLKQKMEKDEMRNSE